MPTWIIIITWVTRAVLVLLLVLSVWSFSIMIDRWKLFKKEEAEDTDAALDMIRRSQRNELQTWAQQATGVRSKVALTLLKAPAQTEKIVRQVSSAMIQERQRLEKGLSVLGSLGSNAPFIGLFGTVLGVIQAFGALSYQQGNMAVVMLAIAEALVATAVGLFVAIPAVVAYNFFLKKTKKALMDCESLRDLFIAQFADDNPKKI